MEELEKQLEKDIRKMEQEQQQQLLVPKIEDQTVPQGDTTNWNVPPGEATDRYVPGAVTNRAGKPRTPFTPLCEEEVRERSNFPAYDMSTLEQETEASLRRTTEANTKSSYHPLTNTVKVENLAANMRKTTATKISPHRLKMSSLPDEKSPLKDLSPNVMNDKQSPKYKTFSRNDSPLRAILGEKNSPFVRYGMEQQVNYVMDVIEDKENMSPCLSSKLAPLSPKVAKLSPKSLFSPKAKKMSANIIAEVDDLENNVHDFDLDQTLDNLNQSVIQFESLQSEAEALQLHKGKDEEILAQLEMIQQKQEELHKLQRTLKSQLAQKLEPKLVTKKMAKPEKKTDMKPPKTPVRKTKLNSQDTCNKTPSKRPPRETTPCRTTPSRGQIRTPGTPGSKRKRTPSMRCAMNLRSAKKTPGSEVMSGSEVKVSSARTLFESQQGHSQSTNVEIGDLTHSQVQTTVETASLPHGHGQTTTVNAGDLAQPLTWQSTNGTERNISRSSVSSLSSEPSLQESQRAQTRLQLTPTVLNSMLRLRVSPQEMRYPQPEKPHPSCLTDAIVPIATPVAKRSPSSGLLDSPIMPPIQTPLAMQDQVLHSTAYSQVNRHFSGSGSGSSPISTESAGSMKKNDRSPYCYFEDISPATCTNSPSYISPPAVTIMATSALNGSVFETPPYHRSMTRVSYVHASPMLSYISPRGPNSMVQSQSSHIASPQQCGNHSCTPSMPVNLFPSPSYADHLGALSLAANVNSLVGHSSVQRVPGLLLRSVALRFHEALLDEEVSLYACRLTSPKVTTDNRLGSQNPLAKILDDGDDMVRTMLFACTCNMGWKLGIIKGQN